MSRSAIVARKVAKQIEYQRDLSKTGDPRYGFHQVVTVEHVAGLIAEQTRRPVKSVTADVKVELEALVAEGVLQRWLDRYGHSHIRARRDHYVILDALPGAL